MKKVQAVTGNLYEHENEYYARIVSPPRVTWYRHTEDGSLNQIEFDSAEHGHLENTLHGYITEVKL